MFEKQRSLFFKRTNLPFASNNSCTSSGVNSVSLRLMATCKSNQSGDASVTSSRSEPLTTAFLKLAKSMGAKFSFGTNNFDDKTKDLARWFEAIELLDLMPADLWVIHGAWATRPR